MVERRAGRLRYEPARIASEIHRLGLDPAKLWIGVGSGQLRPQIDGGAMAHGVLLDWMLPDQIAEARRWVRAGADESERASPVVASYVRVAVGLGSVQRVRDEERRYRTINERHRKQFAAMNVALGSVGVAATTHSTCRSCVCSQKRMRPR